MSWGAHEYFMHPIFVLKNGCDKQYDVEQGQYFDDQQEHFEQGKYSMGSSLLSYSH
jgi:hypothetical protein